MAYAQEPNHNALMAPSPPRTLEELNERVRALHWRTLGEIAVTHRLQLPENLRRHKGWVGQALEHLLGATAGSKAQPDFPHLGVEMKTIPVRPDGRPYESTYVCVAPLDGSMANRWEDSWVRHKLNHVLWVPIVYEAKTPLAQRRLGPSLLWEPTPAQSQALQEDWEGLSELIRLGEFWQMDAFKGKFLQLRPKAANKNDLVWAIDEEGGWIQTNPRGFYLRVLFTKSFIQDHILAHSKTTREFATGKSEPPPPR